MIKSEYTDSFEFHYVGFQPENLLPVLQLAMARYNTAVSWYERDEYLIFNWNVGCGDNKFPFPLGATPLASIVSGWLSVNPPLDPRPNIDGSVSEGYEVIAGDTFANECEIFRIRSIWTHHHQ